MEKIQVSIWDDGIRLPTGKGYVHDQTTWIFQVRPSLNFVSSVQPLDGCYAGLLPPTNTRTTSKYYSPARYVTCNNQPANQPSQPVKPTSQPSNPPTRVRTGPTPAQLSGVHGRSYQHGYLLAETILSGGVTTNNNVTISPAVDNWGHGWMHSPLDWFYWCQ